MIFKILRGVGQAVRESYRRTAKFEQVFGTEGGSPLDAALALHLHWVAMVKHLRGVLHESQQKFVKDHQLAEYVADNYRLHEREANRLREEVRELDAQVRSLKATPGQLQNALADLHRLFKIKEQPDSSKQLIDQVMSHVRSLVAGCPDDGLPGT